jgi:diacylglycerol kinase
VTHEPASQDAEKEAQEKQEKDMTSAWVVVTILGAVLVILSAVAFAVTR